MNESQNNNFSPILTEIHGFYRKENGNLAISYDDIAEIQNFISFFLNSKAIKTKEDYSYVAKIVSNIVEDTIKRNVNKFN